MSMTGGDDLERDRRPTSARHLRVLESLTHAFIKRGVSPNSISLVGLVCGVGAGLCFASTSLEPSFARLAWAGGGVLVLLRLAANLLDGMVAVEGGRKSPTGLLWNEIPDRISDAAIIAGVGCAAGGNVVLGLVAAWTSTMVSYVRVQAAVAGAPQDFTGPMAKPQRMALVLFTVSFQALAPEAWLSAVPLPRIVLAGIVGGSVVTFLRRIRRASAYLNEGTS